MIFKNTTLEASSFRDSDARVFISNGKVYRQIFKSYSDTYFHLMQCGLYEKLILEGLLIPHKEVENDRNSVIIEPEQVFISYPWEWCFSKLKDAALATLKIQKIALEYGMSLKDANFFNIQFVDNRPVLIDTASFEFYKEGEPWCAYRQFCENFLTVLSLMSKVDFRLKTLVLANLDGISLDLASRLLPLKTLLNPGLFMHIHMHARFKNLYSETKKISNQSKMTKDKLKILLDSLYAAINSLHPPGNKTEWHSYYSSTNYTDKSFVSKKELVQEFCKSLKPSVVIDFGANNGFFSRLSCGDTVYSLDMDEQAVEQNYINSKLNQEKNIIPLVYDILNPSPSVGFANRERSELLTRTGRADVVLALAVTHHLRITGNVPFEKQAEYFKSFGKHLIIEYVSKSDSMTEHMLQGRKDVFNDYSEDRFEQVFRKYYTILRKEEIIDSNRILYLLRAV